MTFNVDTEQIRTHATAVGGVQGNLAVMSDAGAPDAAAYGALLGLLGLPGAVTGSVDAVWDAINAAHTGTGQVENGLNHMADRYDVDDDMAAFLLKPTVPVIGPAPSSGGGGGGGASIGPSYAASPSERRRHGGPPGAPVPAGPWRPPPGWTPPRGDHAKTPWDNLVEIPGNLPWRDSTVNAGSQAGQTGTDDD